MIHATAKSYCEAGGMKLLSVQTKAKQQFVLKLKQDNNSRLLCFKLNFKSKCYMPISIHYFCNCNLQLPYFLIFICGGLEAQIKHKRVTGSGLPESLLQLCLFNIIFKKPRHFFNF